MKTIWKFSLPRDNISLVGYARTGIEVEIPEWAEHLSVGLQNDTVVLWALVDPTREKVKRYYRVVFTGDNLPHSFGAEHYIGTVTNSYGLVLHVFEEA